MNEITEQVSLETDSDPAQVQGVVQNLALTDSIEGGNTQELIADIATEVTKPNDQVSKSLNSLAMQEEQGNYEAVNTAVEKVLGGDSRNNVEQLVAAGATTEGVAGAAAPLDEGTTEDDVEITGEELAPEEEDDDSDSEDEGATADEEVPATIDIGGGGKTITISLDHEETDHHFAGQPISGVVTSLTPCSDEPGPSMEVSSSCS